MQFFLDEFSFCSLLFFSFLFPPSWHGDKKPFHWIKSRLFTYWLAWSPLDSQWWYAKEWWRFSPAAEGGEDQTFLAPQNQNRFIQRFARDWGKGWDKKWEGWKVLLLNSTGSSVQTKVHKTQFIQLFKSRGKGETNRWKHLAIRCVQSAVSKDYGQLSSVWMTEEIW